MSSRMSEYRLEDKEPTESRFSDWLSFHHHDYRPSWLDDDGWPHRVAALGP